MIRIIEDAIATVFLGLVLLVAVGRTLGWHWVGALTLGTIGVAAWDRIRRPWAWR